MTFPQTARPMLYELQVGSTDWANITPYVHSLRQVTEITRGIPGEYGQTAPSTASFSINNAGGLFSPRNPLSVLQNQIGKNTPVRISIGEGAYGMVIGGVNGTGANGRAEAADSAQLSPTGDLDLRVDMEILPTSSQVWSTGNFDVISKFRDLDTDRSYSLIVIGGKLRLSWFSLGTAASARTATSSVTLPGTTGRLAVRATIDVNNGAAGVDVKFYTAPTIGGAWTQLGTTVTSAGVSSIFDGVSATRVGSASAASAWTWGTAPACTIYKAEIYASITGASLIASPDFTSQPLDPVPFGLSNFSDAQGNNWAFNGTADAARIWYGSVDIRAWNESSAFPNRWDTSGRDAWVPLDSAGILRRLGQGQEPAQTGLRDWVMAQPILPASYFPLAGAEGTRYSVNLGRVGTNSYRYYPEAAPVYTYGADFGSMYLGTGMDLNATGPASDMRGDVNTTDDNFALDFVFQSPLVNTDSGVADTNIGVLDTYVWSFDYDRWRLRLQDPANGGTLQLSWYANDGVGSIDYPTVGPITALQDNEIHTVRLAITTTGGGITQTARVYIDGVLIDTRTTATARALNGTSLYQMFYSRYAGQTHVTLGHLVGWADPTATPPLPADFDEAARGYAGELAADRLQRIAALGGIPLTIYGNNSDTIAMGPQYSESKLTQLRDAEQADMGVLREPRNRFGLEYRTRVSMVGQAPALTLDYSLGQIVPPFEPTDDDLFTKNDMTVSRREGDSARVQLTTGRMSILDPPAGVGQYHDSVEVNVETDAVLPGIAAWLVNLGTIDQARYPSVTVDLGILAGFGLDLAARAVDTGDLLVITGMDALGVYEDVRLLVLGTGSETISDGAFKHTITWNCAPYQGYEGAVFGVSASTGVARYDADGSQLSAALNTSANSFQVVATKGILWTTDPAAGSFDVMINGERMTVGSVSGATSPQTFNSVTRSVNSVVKSHAAGSEVRLADPAYYSL